MEMIEVKTAELIGPALDWSVAKSEGWKVDILAVSHKSDASTGHKMKATGFRLWMIDFESAFPDECSPSTDWGQGGPLIDKHAISLAAYSFNINGSPGYWVAEPWGYCPIRIYGDTALIAACRAIVAAKLGDTVSVPKELMQ